MLAEVAVDVAVPRQRPAAWELFLLILDNSDVRLFKWVWLRAPFANQVPSAQALSHKLETDVLGRDCSRRLLDVSPHTSYRKLSHLFVPLRGEGGASQSIVSDLPPPLQHLSVVFL